MKAKRRVVPGVPAKRTPTVRRIRPAIAPVPRVPKGSAGPGGPGSPAARAGGPGTGGGAAVGPAGASAALDVLGDRPVDLSVDLGRGLVLATPLVGASGPYGYGVEVADAVDLGRLGALVTRGTTRKARAGHPGPRTADVPGGFLTGVGLQNPGLDAVLERYPDAWARWTVPVLLNLCAESAAEFAELARRADGVAGIAGLELNLSCPGGRGGAAFGLDPASAGAVVAAVRAATDLPVVAKLPPHAPDLRAVGRACEDAGADALCAVNTLPGLAVAPGRDGPLLGSTWGGVSGPALRPVALRAVYELATGVDVPVVGTGGVATLDDVLDLLAVGAAAVGIATAAYADPMLPVRLADELADACRARGLASVDGLRGTALPRRAPASSARGAEYGRTP